MARVDLANLQGFVPKLYRLPISRHLLFSIASAPAARACLRTIAASLTRGNVDLSALVEPLTNLSISWTGLQALAGTGEAPAPDLDRLFVSASPSEVPGTWGNRFGWRDVHVVVHIYCRTEECLASQTERIREVATGALKELDPGIGDENALTCRLPTRDGRLHFGYRDGITQPKVDWDDSAEAGAKDLRHFVLGQATSTFHSKPRSQFWSDLLRDSSYCAFQVLGQDVAAFESYLTRVAPAVYPDLAAGLAREKVAAKMMGRWRDGTPVALSPDKSDPSQIDADFGYADDPEGRRCPLTAHIRLANPRNQKLEDLVKSNFPGGGPFVLRRGMPFGPAWWSDEATGVKRGLVGMFMCSNLANQFATLMRWLSKADFSPVFDPGRAHWQDMITGSREASDDPEVMRQRRTGAIRVGEREALLEGLQRFVWAEGTLLLLVPSINALRAIVNEPGLRILPAVP